MLLPNGPERLIEMWVAVVDIFISIVETPRISFSSI